MSKTEVIAEEKIIVEKYDNRRIKIKTAVTLISRILGSSLLPGGYAFRYMGLIPSLIVLLINILAYIYLNTFVVDSIYYTNSNTWDDLVKKLLNKTMALFFNISIALDSYGTLVGYQIVSSRSIVDVLKKYTNIKMGDQLLKAIITISLAVTCCFPLTLLKSTKQLGKISPFSFALIIFLCGSITIIYMMSFGNNNSICTWTENNKEPIVLKNDYRLFSDDSPLMMMVSFGKYIPMIQKVIATSAFPIVYSDLKGPLQVKRRVFKQSMWIAFAIATTLFACAAFSTSFGFGQHNKASMLESFSPCHFIFMDVVGLSFSVFLILSYPLLLQPAQLVIMQWAKKTPEKNYKFLVLIGFCSTVFTTTLACSLDNIAAIFGLFTAVTGFLMYFFVPLIAYVKLPQLKREALFPSVRQQLKNEAENQVLKIDQDSVKIEVAAEKDDVLVGDKVDRFETQAEIPKYDYKGEYAKDNKKIRRVWMIIWTVLSAGCCVIAFVLNLEDFF